MWKVHARLVITVTIIKFKSSRYLFQCNCCRCGSLLHRVVSYELSNYWNEKRFVGVRIRWKDSEKPKKHLYRGIRENSFFSLELKSGKRKRKRIKVEPFAREKKGGGGGWGRGRGKWMLRKISKSNFFHTFSTASEGKAKIILVRGKNTKTIKLPCAQKKKNDRN